MPRRHLHVGMLTRCLVASLLFTATLVPVTVAQHALDPPIVVVTVDLDAAPLYDALPDRDVLQDSVAAYFSARSASVSAFQFVRWRTPADTASADADVKASLRLHLVERTQQFGSEMATEVHLVLQAATVEREVPELQERVTLYELFDLDKNAQNPVKLLQRIQQAIDAWFDGESAEPFQMTLMEDFLRYVPLANTVIVDGDTYLLIVPLRAEADNASTLRALFSAEKDGMSLGGNFAVEVKGTYPLPGTSEQVLSCKLRQFFYPEPFFHAFAPLDLTPVHLTSEALHTQYGADIRQILSTSHLNSLTIYMNAYRTFADALATEH